MVVALHGMCVMWMCDVCEHGAQLVALCRSVEMDVLAGLVVQRYHA